MKFCIVVVALCAFTLTHSGQAQTAEEDVYSIVSTFFDALLTADSTLMAGILLPGGQAHAIMPTDSTTRVRTSTHQQTLEQMASWTEPIVERMWDPTILVNGPLAVVWGPYDLYVGQEFSHCGVDTFTLIRSDDGWKISSIDYTIERGTCEMHPDGPPSFE
ncbi:MAG: hypothetical protein HKN43_16510 [Rhodothermales bacterium]|nr:hypothetical protein [Rhodothermales bacterium]